MFCDVTLLKQLDDDNSKYSILCYIYMPECTGNNNETPKSSAGKSYNLWKLQMI